MNWLSLFSPTGILAALVIGLSISNVTFIKMYGAANEKLATLRADIETQSRRAAEEAELARLNTATVARLYSDYSDQLVSGYRSRLDGLLRSCGDRQAAAPAAGTAPGLDAGAAQYPASARTFEAICVQTERDAAGDALQLIWLQHYVDGLCRAYGCQ